MKIAIDGPAGAGKSSIAKALAQRLGIRYLDTGAMYRAIAYKTLKSGMDTKEAAAIAEMMAQTTIEIAFSDGGEQRVLVDGIDVTEYIRSPAISAAASNVAMLREVRSALVEYQRTLAEKYDVVMDGRDIGTVVLPDADYKFFVAADSTIRAQRRWEQMAENGQIKEGMTLASVLAEIQERDQRDMTRDVVPLVQAEDAIAIDTSRATLEESVVEIMSHMHIH